MSININKVFQTPAGFIRALGRNTPETVHHWDRLVAGIPVAPRVMRGAVPDESPVIRRFHHKSFLSQRQRGTCFPAGVPISMANGSECSIENVFAGDHVITHTNKNCRVTGTQVYSYTGDMYSVKIAGYGTLTPMTADHPIAVVEDSGENRWGHFRAGEMVWKAARDLQVGDRVLMPYGQQSNECIILDMKDVLEDCDRPYELSEDGQKICVDPKGRYVWRYIAIDSRLARLTGLFLAEGSHKKRVDPDLSAGVRFSFGRHEDLLHQEVVSLIREIFGVESSIRPGKPGPNSTTVDVNNSAVGWFFRWFVPGDVYTKRIPFYFFRVAEYTKIALVRGWMDGDGHCKKMRYYRSFSAQGTSSSKSLRHDMFRLLLSCRIKPGEVIRKRETHQTVEPGDLYLYGRDSLRVYPERQSEFDGLGLSVGRGKRYTAWEHGFLCPVKAITTEPVIDIPVYNFEVEGDHSYVANLLASHNCVGHNTASTLMTRMRIPPDATATTGTPLPLTRLSPLYIYDISRMEARQEGVNLGNIPGPQGDGSIGSCAIKACHALGCVKLEDYDSSPHAIDIHRNGTVPPSDVQGKGKQHIVKEFAVCDSFEHGLEMMGAGFPVCFCSDVPEGMMHCDAKGFFRMTGAIAGGHDYSVLDYSKKLDLAWIAQSWEYWGEQNSDPAYAEMHGYTQIGTCPLSELANYFTPQKMANGSSEIYVANSIQGWDPVIVDYSIM